VCNNGQDDDGDGLVDCDDPECNDDGTVDCKSATERTICYGEPTDIGMETPHCASWEPADGIQNPHSNFIEVRPDKTTIYKMHITNDQGDLIETKMFTVNVLSKLPVTITATESIICTGVTSTLSANPGYTTYLWSTTEEDQSINVDVADTYSVTVTNDNGCKGDASIEIEAAEEVEVQIQPSPAIICAGQQIELTAPHKSGNDYQWSTNDGDYEISQNPEKIIATEVGTYTVTVTYANGCQSTGSAEVVSNEDLEDIQTALTNAGFVCIPMTITEEPPPIKPKNPNLEKNEEVVDNQAPGIEFSFDGITGESLTTEELKTLLEGNLTGGDACSQTPKGLITADESFCEGDFYGQNKGNFSNNDLGIWMHILDGEGDNDCLMVKSFRNGESNNVDQSSTGYLSDVIAEISEIDPTELGNYTSSEAIVNIISSIFISSSKKNEEQANALQPPRNYKVNIKEMAPSTFDGRPVITIDEFIELVKEIEAPYSDYEQRCLKRMITRIRKIFYNLPGWDKFLIPDASETESPFGTLDDYYTRERGRIKVNSTPEFDLIDTEYHPCIEEEIIVGPPYNLTRCTKKPEIYLNQQVVLTKGMCAGTYIDMGHVFAGLDAFNYPDRVLLPNFLGIQNNIDAVTWVGDLGSSLAFVMFESFNQPASCEPCSYNSMSASIVQRKIDEGSPGVDMLGNIDAYAIASAYSSEFNKCGFGPKVSEILENFYLGKTNLRFTQSGLDFQEHRFSRFASQIGLDPVNESISANELLKYIYDVKAAAGLFAVAGGEGFGKYIMGHRLWQESCPSNDTLSSYLVRNFFKELIDMIRKEP